MIFMLTISTESECLNQLEYCVHMQPTYHERLSVIIVQYFLTELVEMC